MNEHSKHPVADKIVEKHHGHPEGVAAVQGTVTAVTPEAVVRFTVNGVVKSLNKPVTAAELYRVAGDPPSLRIGDKVIENKPEPVEIEQDAEITTA